MITFLNVRNRISSLKNKGGINESNTLLPVKLQRKIAIDKHDIYQLKNIMENWRTIYKDESHSFRYLLESIDEYFTNYTNEGDLNSIIYEMKNNVIPSISNLNENAEYIAKFASKYDTSILDEARLYKRCDRLINNQDQLNKVQSKSIDRYIRENYNIYDECDTETIYGACDIINSYKMSFATKFNVALENVLYTIDNAVGSNGYNKKAVLESIIDRFCQYEDNDINLMKKVLESNDFYSDDDKVVGVYLEGAEVVYLEGKKITKEKAKQLITSLKEFIVKKVPAPKMPSALKTILNKIYTRSEQNIVDDLPNFLTWFRKFFVFSTLVVPPVGLVAIFVDKCLEMKLSRQSTTDMLNKMNSEKAKIEKKISKSSGKTKTKYEEYLKELKSNISKVEDYADTLYTDKENDKRHGYDTDDSIEESAFLNLEDNQLSVSDYFEFYHKEVYKEVQKIYNAVSRFSSPYIQPMEQTELDGFKNCSPKTLYKFLGGDSEIVIKVASWLNIFNRNDLIKRGSNIDSANKEIRQRLESLCDRWDSISDDFTVYFDGDDDLFSIYAVLNCKVLDTEQDKFDQMTEDNIVKQLLLAENAQFISENNLEDAISNIDENTNMEVLPYVCNFIKESNIINPDNMILVLKELKRNINNTLDGKDKYTYASLVEDTIYSIMNKEDNKEPVFYLEEFDRYTSAVKAITEGKIKNKFKLANSRIKNKAINLNTKQKVMSKRIDDFVDNFYDKSQRELSNKNREKVIKGTVLPSFSTLIKLAIASAGTGVFLNPVLGAITFVGGLAVSKKGTKKEKQYILDEIEIQLELVEKKISLAESNNDMKALEDLLKTKQRLQKEKQRIIYDGRARNFRQPLNRD